MVRHIVTWNFKEYLTEAEKKDGASKVKFELESLIYLIDGIIELKFYADILPTSNRDAVLDSLFKSPEALAAYQVHLKHLEAGKLVQEYFCDRICIDYIEEKQ